MLNGGGLLRQYNGGGSGIQSGAAHYVPLTMLKLSKILKTSAASNQAGSTQSVSLLNSSERIWLFAVDNKRFISFMRNSSNYACASVVEIGASTTAVTATALRSASASICAVRQNPVNPLQFAVLTNDEYVHIVTVATGSGQTITTNSHNLAGSLTTPEFGIIYCDVVWSDDGTYMVVCSLNSNTSRAAFSLYTVASGTPTYVNNTAGSNSLSSIAGILAEKTGESGNEFVCSVINGTTNGHIYRITFTSSAVTIAMQLVDTDGAYGTYPAAHMRSVAGPLHIYADGSSPYPTSRRVFDGTGSGQIYTSKSISNGMGLNNDNTACVSPYGPNMMWDLVPDSSPYDTYPALRGFGCGFLGRENLWTRSALVDGRGFCVSHDYSTSVIIGCNGATWYFSGFNTPT